MLCTGETVTGAMRRDCKAVFGARVIDRYTCEEAGWLALQCPKHEHLHVFTSNTLIEIVDAQGIACPVGMPGRVLVTALHSHAMPLIRY
ncbi:phenylacetate--CoA ligase family protein, partial [Halobellus sp. Atlit-31R]